MRTLACVSLLLALSACGDKAAPADGVYDFAGAALDLTVTPGSDLAGVDLYGDMAKDPNAPVITIVAPLPTAYVVGDTLTVKVSVASPIGSPISAVSLMVPTQMNAVTLSMVAADTYSGTVNITGAPAMAGFTVSATDSSMHTGTVLGTYLHDTGPHIGFVQPSAMASALGSLPISVTVSDPLFPTIDPSKVKAYIRNPAGDITLAVDAGKTPLQLSGVITFSSFTNPALDGVQRITVTATNSNNTTATATRDFTVDNAGPVITITSPLAGEFAFGLTTITATITDDPTGIDENTVYASFGGSTMYQTKLTRTGGATSNTFKGSFDVRTLGNDYVLPLLSVRADDLVGNHAEVGYAVAVDNQPPVLSLDPVPMRVAKLSNAMYLCSVPFDPVGGESASDGDTVLQVVSIKARIEDVGNNPPGNLVERISAVDPLTVKLVVIPTPANAGVIAVDTDGDTFCDDVNPNLVLATGMVAGSNESIQPVMVPLLDTGLPNYFTSGAAPAGCDVLGDPTVTTPPPPLCSGSGTFMTYALHYSAANLPSIWSLPVVSSTPTGCVGAQLDTLNSLPQGPACAVVVAKDKAGNRSVSAPIRFCIDRGGNACVGFVPTANCTGTYNPTTKVTSTTACTPRTSFVAGEVRRIN